MSKRSPEDILKDIEDSDLEEAADKALAMSAGERRTALEAAGFSKDEIHAKADAWHERMRRAPVDAARRRLEADAVAKSLHPPARRWPAVVAFAAAAAVVVLAVLLVPRRPERETPMATPSAPLPTSATVVPSPPTPPSTAVGMPAPPPSAAPSASARDAGEPAPTPKPMPLKPEPLK